MTVSFIFVFVLFSAVAVMGIVAFSVQLYISALQSTRSSIPIREHQTDTVIATRFAIVNNNNRIREAAFTVYFCYTLDFTRDEIDDLIIGNTCALQ